MKASTHGFKLKRLVLITGLVFGMAACGNDDLAPPPSPPAANNAPVVSSTGITTANEDQVYTYTFAARDADADALTLAATTLPAWLVFDPATGVLSGTPLSADVGNHDVTLTVTDGTDTSSESFTIVVTAAPDQVAPIFTSTGIVAGMVGSAYSYTATAEDDNFDDLTFSASVVPAWAAFDVATAILSGTPDIAGDYDVELMVSDGTDAATQMFTITVATANVETLELSVFENAELPEWAAWTDNGGPTTIFTVPGDADRDQAMKFGPLTKPSVAGFIARAGGSSTAVNGVPFDASGIVSNGQITFELQLLADTTAPNNGWFFKVESGSGANAVEVPLSSSVESHSAPALNTWQTYTFPLSSLSGGSLNFSGIDIFMVFPSYGEAAGAEYLIDNFKIVSVEGGGDTGGGDGAVTDFEGAIESYSFSDFEGGVASVIANPDASGINPSAQVGQMVKNAGQDYAGSTLTLGSAVDIPADAVITMKVWSSRAVPVLFKLEGGPVGEITATHGGSGWEELSFDFTGVSGAGNTGVTLIFDNGTVGDAANDAANWTFYFDDIIFPVDDGGGEVGDTTVTDFEGAIESYSFSDFEGGVASVIANPDASGINPSAQVGQMVKNAGQNYAGSTLTLDSAIDIPADAMITMKVWSSRVVPVLFKLEGGPVGEITAAHGGSGWEELSFDFTGISGAGNTGVTLIFDNGTVGDAANDAANWTFYFDDITFPGTAGSAEPPVTLSTLGFDFEPDGNTGTWTVFEDTTAPLEFVANPDMTGANTSATVAKFTAPVGAANYAGTETESAPTFTLDATNSIVRIMVWKTTISDVGIKFANAAGGAQGELKISNTVVNAWEEMTFDLSGNIGLGDTSDLVDVVVFPDFIAGERTVESVVYFDNITFSAN
ncbi:putative Ig domain-containing protein [Glaciecola sp. 33A]|jgi:hypothetical protein|uniref:putative Ig domain-containing protein n=1 Tax=Glaciecola sp. 33A TaxID=2057807 RepID=UPI000C345982|nr:putative Ig domain-containing protein [Glaciecola sp. 33A]PKI01807.1 hypothetical protein CXF81_08865 [Glaciecola sp. 33A]